MQKEFTDKLELIKNWLQIKSDRKLAEKLQLTPEKLRSYINGSQPTLPVLRNILLILPEINPDWLILDGQEMFRRKEEKKVEKGPNENDIIAYLKEELKNERGRNDKMILEIGKRDQKIEDLESQLAVFLPENIAAESVIKKYGRGKK